MSPAGRSQNVTHQAEPNKNGVGRPGIEPGTRGLKVRRELSCVV